MKPLFQAVLDYYAQGHEASRAQVQEELRADYGKYKCDDEMIKNIRKYIK